MFKFLAILVLAVEIATAYDSSDSDFKKFEVFDKDVTFSRHTRDTEVEKKKTENKEYAGDLLGESKKGCCEDDIINVKGFKQFLAIQEPCRIKYRTNNSDVDNFDPFDCEKMARIKKSIICEVECTVRNFNLTHENGTLIREPVIKFFEDYYVGETKWKKDVNIKYIDSCFTEIEGKQQEKDEECNSVISDFRRCIWGKFFMGCPAELRVDSPRCNKLRDQLSQDSEAFLNNKFLEIFLNRA